MPGTLLWSNGREKKYWVLSDSQEIFTQETFEKILKESIRSHELSDVTNVALLSGGLDSGVITTISRVSKCYTVGLIDNNEFKQAKETADSLGRQLVSISLSAEELQAHWRALTRLRGEPLSLPNEGLIYAVCRAMSDDEKVVLTGEGADELLFGYDGIFHWAMTSQWSGIGDFLSRYGYSSDTVPTQRLIDYVENLRAGKTLVEFVEDYFYHLHLPGLLRRMDFASMAASKEARVPFVSKALVQYMYRRPPSTKLSDAESKIPLRRFAEKLGLQGPLNRKKIGFSAQINPGNTRQKEYNSFQEIVIGELGW
jgi:asparagine synthase (glutamine-hydrolysing)